MDGLKFRRQRPLGRYVADFCCDALNLVVEIDGSVHDTPEQQDYDAVPDATLAAYGLTVIHLRVEEVTMALPQALSKIRQAIRRRQANLDNGLAPS